MFLLIYLLSENPDLKAVKGINSLKVFYGKESLIAGFIASRTLNAYPLGEKMLAVPGSDIDQYLYL